MDTTTLMRSLGEARAEWTWPEGTPRHEDYFDGVLCDWAYELERALCARAVRLSELRKVCEVLERALTGGDEDTAAAVEGFFDYLIGLLYCSLEEGAAVERALGSRGRAAWGDLIEAFVGGGVRTMARWAAVIRSGPTEGYRRRGPDGERTVRRGEEGGVLVTVSPSAGIRSERALTVDEVERELEWLRPLVGRRWVGPLGEGDEEAYGLRVPFATLQLLDDEGPEVRYGRGAPGGGCFVTDGRSVWVAEAWWA